MKTNSKAVIRPILLLLVIVSFTFLYFNNALATGVSFHEDYKAIEKAAKSVLMLEVYDESGSVFKSGSGFVAFDNLTLITNYHVLKDAFGIKAYSDEGYYYILNKVIAADSENDIAILGFESPTNLVPLEMAGNTELLRGQPVVAIGSPEGIRNTVSVGNISTIVLVDDKAMIQFTAPISHGSSGGALFNDDGKVIGVTSAIYEEGQNLNYAVDIENVLQLFSKKDEKPLNIAGYDQMINNQTPSVTVTPHPTAAPKPTAIPTPVPTPTLKPHSKVSDLIAKQIGTNSVKIEWKENSKGKFTYYVGVEYADNPYYEYFESTSTSYVLENLAPGYEYKIYVSTSDEFVDAPFIMQSVQEAEKYTSRNFKTKSFTISYYNLGEDILEAKKTKVTKCKTSDLEKAGVIRDYIAVLNMSIGKSEKETPWDILLTLTMPNDHVYSTSWNDYPFSKEGGTTFFPFSLNDSLSQCSKWENGFQKGEYTIKLYINGQFAAKTNLKVN